MYSKRGQSTRQCYRELAADLPSRMTSEDHKARPLAMNSILIMLQRTEMEKSVELTLDTSALNFDANSHLSLTFEHCMKWGFELVENVFEAIEFVCRVLLQRPT